MTKAFEIKNMVKKYPGFQLGPLNLELEPGIVLGYIGPNGSGKTTTLHSIVGLIKTDDGEIDIFGQRNNPNDPSWKLNIGYVGDMHVFYENWSAAKNLKFISRFYPNWSDALAADLINRFDLPIDKKAKALSSGNRVKLSLVSALAHYPKLLLLDEPTAGLDPVVRTEVLDVLFSVLESGERSIFYSTHILSDISRLADELAFLNEGQLLQRSSKDDLLDNWRTISFRYSGEYSHFESVVSHMSEGNNHQIISSNKDIAFKEIQQIGVQNFHETRMTIDEIAVHILKGARNVVSS